MIEWETAGEPVVFPKMDSSVLPVRIDKRDMQYTCSMGAVERGESKPYSIKEMRFAISRAAANSGTLGMYCNLLMIFVAAVGNLPNSLHLPLEVIIDATVKNGNDVSSDKDWCYFQAGSASLRRDLHSAPRGGQVRWTDWQGQDLPTHDRSLA